MPAAVSPFPRRRRPAAFTLIELLVVISIISLLIAMLLPALGRARDASRAIACMSNMKGLATAIHMIDNEERGIPRANAITEVFGSSGELLDGDWIKHVGAYMRGMTAHVFTQKGMHLTDQYYACPLVTTRTGPSATQMGMNEYFDPPKWQWESPAATYAPYGLAPLNTRRFRVDQVKTPTNAFLLGDSSVGTGAFAPIIIQAGIYAPDARHANAANIAYVDGHAKATDPTSLADFKRYQFLRY